MTGDPGRRDIARVLDAAEAASPVEAVEAVTRELGRAFGAVDVSFLITDLSGRALVRLAHLREEPNARTAWTTGERRSGEESATVVPFDGGPVEQVVRSQETQVLANGDAWTVLSPVTERGESIGLLELTLPEHPEGDTLDDIARCAHVLAFVIIANRRHTDMFEWGQRGSTFSLSAEIQQRLLPLPRTCEAAAFTLSGWLEPAASIGGDTFDYSLARDLLHISMTDAMGHGVAAALTATLCVGSLRGARRRGATLLEQAQAANEALCTQSVRAVQDDFVTGLLGRLDLPTGSLALVNAGHVAPFLARGDELVPIELPVDLPFGLFGGTVYRGTTVQLLPGDRVVLVTDGMLERNADRLDLPAAITRTRALHPREAVRALADDALEATGHALSDDATVLCLDWYGQHDGVRTTVAGADPHRASEAVG